MLARAALLGAVLVAAASAAAGAHTAVRSAHPGPGATVSGVVDRVVLEFLDPVAGAPDIEVRAPDGGPVPGARPATLSSDGRVGERRFDPLVEAGRYRVDYTYVALDGAAQVGAHEFRYQADGTTSSSAWGAAVIGAGALGSVAVVLAVAARVRRAAWGDDSE